MRDGRLVIPHPVHTDESPRCRSQIEIFDAFTERGSSLHRMRRWFSLQTAQVLRALPRLFRLLFCAHIAELRPFRGEKRLAGDLRHGRKGSNGIFESPGRTSIDEARGSKVTSVSHLLGRSGNSGSGRHRYHHFAARDMAKTRSRFVVRFSEWLWHGFRMSCISRISGARRDPRILEKGSVHRLVSGIQLRGMSSEARLLLSYLDDSLAPISGLAQRAALICDCRKA